MLRTDKQWFACP